MARFPFSDQITHLLSQYEALLPVEQEFLQLISVIFETTSSKNILSSYAELTKGSGHSSFSEGPSPFAMLRKFQERDLLTWRYQCNPLIVEIMSRKAVAAHRFDQMARIAQNVLPAQGEEYENLNKKSQRHVREMRIGLYLGDFNHFNEHLLRYYECPETSEQDSPLVAIINNPFDAQWFQTLPAYLQLHGLREISRESHLRLEPLDLPLQYLKQKSTLESIPEAGWPSIYYLIIVNLLLQGNIDAARRKISEAGHFIDSLGLRGWLHFLEGDNEKALADFKQDLKELRKTQEQKNAFFIGEEGLIFLLALLKSGDFSKYATISSYLTSVETLQPGNSLLPAYRALQQVARAKLENFTSGDTLSLWSADEKDGFSALFMALGNFWLNGRLEKQQRQQLYGYFERARQSGYNWLAMEYASILSRITEEESYKKFSQSLCRKAGVSPLFTILPHENAWQRALKALNLVSRQQEGSTTQCRLAWLVDFKDGFITISPKEQKLSARGQWSKGRSVSLKRLYSGQALDFLTEQDQKIRASLHRKQGSEGISYEFDMDETLTALIGHPYLFSAQAPSVPVEFTKGEPELRVEKKADKLHLKFSPPLGDEKVIAVQETQTRFRVIEISAKHKKITSIISDDGLTIPTSARKQVLQTLGSLSSCLTIHSDIGGSPADIAEVTASDKIIIQLLPVGAGFRISMLVKPFGHAGPYLYPGQGSANVIAEIEGKRKQTQRNLEKERANCASIEDKCPTLARLGVMDGEWFIDDLQDCLEILSELEDLGDEVRIEWPEGEKISIRHQASFKNLHLHIRHRQNWFELDGELTMDQDKVMEMKKLLDLAKSNSGRFISLGRGQFLELSREFRKQLDELNSFTSEHDKKVGIHPLASCALEGFTESGIEVSADPKWQEQLKRISDSRKLQPEVPATLQAELRDYQLEGFKWLARLMHWGVGACLADDMGLGKTVQALGIIVQQAPKGPSLVVAPTSVCMNWLEEIHRFAPTLRPVLFGGKDRKSLIESLSPFDVLICSYGLLQQEDELLSQTGWQVIILDEAQAIKNIATKRSKAAMALSGDFKMITTGTPIENHLGELWNLFNFINPGLLGSLEQFNRRFALPIERDKDKKARQRLKKLIQPFILRRLKSQVIEELPPRTEVVLHVDMSQEEAAFYEAIRQNALEKIERTQSQAGQKHMQILAEIMKLRLASCNPRLVQSDTTISSSKLELFGTIISELIDNRHRALVFSQFARHLKIIRSFLDEQNISYKYLDGTTPARKRQEQVTEFQAGQGDLFLISLKAGGLGLNLTAADYVLHMDPWWNPAVEDQASDRAHRIGQTHPVTVYRLVTKNSIEEKILKLHHAKRKLADSLLEGSDMSHKMTADELLQLLQKT